MASQAPRHHDLASTVTAVEANLFSFFQQLKGWRRVEVHDDEACCWTISDLPYPLFNSVMRARLAESDVDHAIDARMQSCRDRDVPMLWWTGPSTQPANLGERLDGRGFLLEPAFGMSVDLGDQPSTAASGADRIVADRDRLTIDRVADRATMEVWSRVLCDGFGAPSHFGDAFIEMAEAIGVDADSPFRHYLARINGEPVATSSLFFGAGIAGIYDVATVPERRRVGIGASITRHAMNEARNAGYRLAILHASTLGRDMYRSLGFELVCEIGQYVWAP